MGMFDWIRKIVSARKPGGIDAEEQLRQRRRANGLDPVVSDDEKSDLLYALRRGDRESVRNLLERGMPMHDAYVVRYEKDWHDDLGPGLRRGVYGSPLSFVVEDCPDLSADDRVAMAKLLIEHGADPRRPSYENCNSLVVGAAREPQLLAYLVSQGADLHHVNSDDMVPAQTLARRAAHSQTPDLSPLVNLIEAGADINRGAPDGLTPVASVSAIERPQAAAVVKQMVELGADVHLKNAYGNSAMDVATPDCRAMIHALAAKAELERLLAPLTPHRPG